MIGPGFTMKLQLLLAIFCFILPFGNAASDCTNQCLQVAVNSLNDTNCDGILFEQIQCVCSDLDSLKTFHACHEDCDGAEDGDILTTAELCEPISALRSSDEKQPELKERDTTSALTMGNENDVSPVARPTTLPSIGWCGVPGSPCFKLANYADRTASILVAPTTLATYGVPGSLDLTWSAPTGIASPIEEFAFTSAPHPSCTTVEINDTECNNANGVSYDGPPSSAAGSKGQLVKEVGVLQLAGAFVLFGGIFLL